MPDDLSIFARWGLDVLGALTILAVGWLVAGWAAGLVRKAAGRNERLDKAIVTVLSRLTRFGIIAVTFYAVLSQFGVDMAAFLAVFGAAGLAVGLALQGTLSNVAAGVMLLGLRPFRVGDAIDIEGTMGVVDDIGLFATQMRTFDGIPQHVPNSQVWGNAIKNFSTAENRRIDLVVGIGYQDDMKRALDVLREVIEADERVLAEPAAEYGVDSLGDSSVNLLGRYCVARADFLSAKMAITQQVKERFDAEGISIPFPQRDVHLFQDAPIEHRDAAE
jgi:small conductance mechanosensitive channel